MTEQPDDWDTDTDELPDLKVRCTDSDCDNDLHCFKRTRKMVLSDAPRGECRECHETLVDLDRTRRRETHDGEYLRFALEKELIRHHFWHLPLDQRAVDHATRKGRIALHEAVDRRLRTSVGGANPFRDGTQTPMSGNVIYYAQHATASCCRTCIEYWHGIEKGRSLSEEELQYLGDLIRAFLDERLPQLGPEGKRVPRRRRANA